MREACFRAKEWQEENPRIPPLVMSVNLSASQLSRSDLAETVERVLGETGLEGSRLILDVTETVYVKVLAANTAILDRLRVLGVRFSIDDFGYRLLLPLLPQAPSRRRHQDRPALRQGPGGGRRGHGDRTHDHRAGPHLGFGGHSRRGGDRRAGGSLKGDGLRHRPGLSLLEAVTPRSGVGVSSPRPSLRGGMPAEDRRGRL